MKDYFVTIYYTSSVNYTVKGETESQAEDTARAIEEPEETFYPKIHETLELSDIMIEEDIS